MSQSTARHFAPPYVLRSFESSGDERASAAQAPVKDEKTGVNVYRVDQGKLVLHADPDSVSTSKARLDDLYVDPTHTAYKSLEKSMSQLETDALGVVRTLVYSISKSKPNVQITRRALNTLHRFLFIMWCRHTDRGAQLIDGQLDERTKQALDRHIARNFNGKPAQPLDVWLQNLRELLDDKFVDIFTNEKIFLPDRKAFETDCRLGRLALWRSAPDVDFITAFNCCGIYDGWPVEGGAVDAFTGVQSGGRAMLARVKVFPLHPNLALAILHPSMTTSGVSPAMYDTLLSRGSSPFAEFPAFAPDVRYANLSPAARKAQRTGDTRVLESGGKKVSDPAAASGSSARRIDGRLLEAREDDMLTFTPAHLSARQTLLVNALVLHTAAGGVVFRSPRQLHHSLSAYSKDFATWGPKQDYTRLQELLRLHEQGKPFPDDPEPLALPEPERRSATPELISPMSSRPGSPLPGRKSARQKRREREERKLMRQALGLASPALTSPATSDAELPDEGYFASPLSASATLVEEPPVSKSIEATIDESQDVVAEKHSEHDVTADEEPTPELAGNEQTQQVTEEPVPEHVAEEQSAEESTAKEAAIDERTGEEHAVEEDAVEEHARPASPAAEPELQKDVPPPAETLDASAPLPLGDVFPEEEAKAVLREALGHSAVDVLEGEKDQSLPEPHADDFDEAEAPRVQEVTHEHHEQDDAAFQADEIAGVMSHVPPTFDATEHEAVAHASLGPPEDPFDDSHAVHDHDEQEGAHAQALEHVLHRDAESDRPRSQSPPAVPFRPSHQRSPPLSPLDLEALVGRVYEVYDIANAVNQAGSRVAGELTQVANMVVRHADDVLVPVDDDEALETASTTRTRTSSMWMSETSEGRIPDADIGPLPPRSQTSEEADALPLPDIKVTPATPALRPLPEVESEVRQRAPTAEKQEAETSKNEKQAGGEKDKAPVQYTLTQKVVIWMVLLFLLMFAFPFIVLRTAFNLVMAAAAHRRGVDNGMVHTTGQQTPAGTGTSHEL